MGYIGQKGADIPNKSLNRDYNLSDLTDAETARSNFGVASSVDVRRNLITNPCMQASQENGDTAGSTSNYYFADEWRMEFATSAGVISSQRIQSTTLAGALDRGRISVTTPDGTLDANEYLLFAHKIEGSKLAHAQFGTPEAKDLVFRFMGNFPAGTYCISLRNHDVTRSFVREFTAVAGVDTVYEVTFPGDTSGTWVTGDVVGAILVITLACGTTYQTTPDSWQVGNYIATSSISNGLGAIQSFEIGDVGLKLDPDGIGYGEFEVPDPAENLRACQRYYVDNGNALIWSGYVSNGSYYYGCWELPTTMRAIPTMAFTDVANSAFPAGAPGVNSVYKSMFRSHKQGNVTVVSGYYQFTYVANARM